MGLKEEARAGIVVPGRRFSRGIGSRKGQRDGATEAVTLRPDHWLTGGTEERRNRGCRAAGSGPRVRAVEWVPGRAGKPLWRLCGLPARPGAHSHAGLRPAARPVSSRLPFQCPIRLSVPPVPIAYSARSATASVPPCLRSSRHPCSSRSATACLSHPPPRRIQLSPDHGVSSVDGAREGRDARGTSDSLSGGRLRMAVCADPRVSAERGHVAAATGAGAGRVAGTSRRT